MLQSVAQANRALASMRAPTAVSISLLCLLTFGVSLTAYVLFTVGHPYPIQIVSSAIKVPLIIVLSTFIAIELVLLIGRPLKFNVSRAALTPPAIYSMLVNSLILLALAPIMAMITSHGNYSIAVFSAYAAFAVAGLLGCLAFYLRFAKARRGLGETGARRVAITWTIVFAILGSQIGWNIRPLIGWTGQPFSLFRHSSATIFDQIRAEGANMKHGGLRFPTPSQQCPTEKWPCR